ncbi:MAG: DUF4412 domain-containing protein [Chloroherpetonaceae bacterium]|nr:DUF4412 domain-containing protein [Chloroherpetonaceae bacterium]
MRVSVYLVAFLAFASSALAQFEGVIEMKMTATSAAGQETMTATMVNSIKGASFRGETSTSVGGTVIKQIMLLRGSEPNKIYMLNPDTKTYTEMDIASMTDAMTQSDEDYEVKKVGSEKILGYNCTRVQVKWKKSQLTMEMWTTKDVLDWATYVRMQNNPALRSNKLATALRNAGADGMALKVVSETQDGGKNIMEVVKVERKAVPASLFEIPKDYKKSEGMFGIPGMTKEKMQEMMKQMKKQQN